MKKQSKSKLSLEKFKIAKLDNKAKVAIKGGHCQGHEICTGPAAN